MNLEKLDIVKAGATINVLNAMAKVDNKFLKIDIDKWSNVKPSDIVNKTIHFQIHSL